MLDLSLHHLTALDASPEALIAIAGSLGCSHVCLFAFVPEQAAHRFPVMAQADESRLRDALAAAEVALGNVEVFPLDSDASPARYRRALALAAALGASRATAHIHAADLQTAIVRFADFCDVAADFGLTAGLEFNAFSAIRDPATAAAIVRSTGRPNGDIALDLLHLVRSGSNVADVAAIADITGYVQLCDGPLNTRESARWHEAIEERMLPGEGEFPLAQLIAPLRAGTLFAVEVPQAAARKAGATAHERARRAVAAARNVLGGCA